MNKNREVSAISSKELQKNFDIFSIQISSGTTILVEDENKKPLTYLVEPELYKKLSCENYDVAKQNIKLQKQLNNAITATSCKLLKPEKLDASQKRLLQIKSKLPFFDNCTDMELISVVENVKILKLEPNEIIFLENDTSKGIYYVVSGSIDILKNINNSNTPKKVGQVLTKDVFGEMSHITKKPRIATAQVSKKSPAVLISFNIKEKIPLNMEYIYMKIYHNFAYSLSNKLDRTNFNL